MAPVKTIFSPFMASRSICSSDTSPLQLCEARLYLSSMLTFSVPLACVPIGVSHLLPERCSPRPLTTHTADGRSGLGLYCAGCMSWREQATLRFCSVAPQWWGSSVWKTPNPKCSRFYNFLGQQRSKWKSKSLLHAWNYIYIKILQSYLQGKCIWNMNGFQVKIGCNLQTISLCILKYFNFLKCWSIKHVWSEALWIWGDSLNAKILM